MLDSENPNLTDAKIHRPSVTRNLGRNLRYLRNPTPQSQVLVKPLNSSSWVSPLLSRKSPHQNHRLDLEIDDTPVTANNRQLEMEKWNVAFVALENITDDSLESTLDSLDLCLDEEFVLAAIKKPLFYLFPSYNLCRFLKWASSKKEFRATTSILESVKPSLDNYYSIDFYLLWEWVKEISEKENGLLNATILKPFLWVFCDMRNVKAVFEVYEKFEEIGCIWEAHVYKKTLITFCDNFAYDLASSVCQNMLDTGMLPGSAGVYRIISRLCQVGRAKEAHRVYLAARNRILIPSPTYLAKSLSRVVYSLSKEDETVHLAQETLLRGVFKVKSREYFHDSFLRAIRGLCRTKDIEGAKKLLFRMIERGPPPGSEVFHSIIRCLSKSGDLEDAREILELAEGRGLTPKISSYGALISGYVKAGLMDKACKFLFAAKKKLTEVCPIGFYALIHGYCALGEFVKALKLFLEMNNYGILPNLDEYNKLIQSLSLCLQDLDPKTAQEVLEEMREKGVYLPHITEGLERAVKELQQGMIVESHGTRLEPARSRVVLAQVAQTRGLFHVWAPSPKWLASHGTSKLLGGQKLFQNRKQHWEVNWVVPGLRFITTGIARVPF